MRYQHPPPDSVFWPGKVIMPCIWLAVMAMGVMSCGDGEQGSWESRLYSPTLITEIDDTFFVVDAWHNRILFNDDLDDDLDTWETLDGELAGPHSIAGNGRVLVVDDTGFHRAVVYEDGPDGFERVQEIGPLGQRPHRVHYCPNMERFLVLGSRSQTMHILVDDGQRVRLEETVALEFLEGAYTRSFTIVDEHLYFVSGPSTIHRVRYLDRSFDVLDEYETPWRYREMNDITVVGDQYYLTVTADWRVAKDHPDNTIVRCDELAKFSEGGCDDVKEELQLQGIPYYLSYIDGNYYIPMVNQHNGIARAIMGSEGKLEADGRLFDHGPPTESSLRERFRLPK